MPAVPLPDPPLDDGVVALRRWSADDVEAIVAACQDPEIPRWTAIPSPYHATDAREFLRRSEPARRIGSQLDLAVVDSQAGDLLGACGLARVDWDQRTAEIGYWVVTDARRRGIGTRAVRLLSGWAMESLGLERLEILVNPGNEPSQRLAASAGFKPEGVMRSYRRRKGAREDLIMFSLLGSDPQAGRVFPAR